jgi:HlyD family secretion protein
MKALAIISLVVLSLGGAGAVAYRPIMDAIAERNRPKWRTDEVIAGDLELVVNATGTVEPTKRVTVGAVVSGPISELLVDFNSKVTKDELMARIDPRIYDAAAKRDRAVLKTREAEIERADAMLQQAVNDENRSKELSKNNSDFVSQTELDELKFSRMARKAEVVVAVTNAAQAQAQLDNSIANLEYTEIRSPVDGIVIDRKIDSGQTLAANFQTPEMFVVAPEMDERMHIYASVDEADIGLIRDAQASNQPVRFTVDAYPDRLFEEGKIVQVRLSSATDQNVVTYPVIVETPNTDLKLLPGMTANLSFQIEKRKDLVKVPNSAIRFYPDRLLVHPDDRPILDGTAEKLEAADNPAIESSAKERSILNRDRNLRHVWIQGDQFLRAVPITLGASDNRFSELIEGDLKPGQKLVIGKELKQP